MRILFISGSPPYPQSIGSNQRVAAIYRALAQHGEVDLFLAIDECELPESHLAEMHKNYGLIGIVAPLLRGQQGIWRFLRPIAPKIVDRLADLLADRRRDYQKDPNLATELSVLMEKTQYDAVATKLLSLAMKSGIPPDYPFLLDVDDVEIERLNSQINNSYSIWPARLLARWRLAQLKNFVPDLYCRFPHCWVIKPRDRKIAGLEHAVWLGMPYSQPEEGLPPLAPSDPASKVIMMLGSYYHRPNAEGLDWFVRRVWPRVKATVHDAEFRIIGPGLSPRRAKAYGRISGIRVLGTVPSVLPQYQECAFTVAPIWTGAGINVKVLESYAFGRTCVLTSFAYRGYEDCLELDQSVRVASNPEDYASACIDLLRDPSLRDRLAAAGHPNVLRDFSFERFAKVVGETFRKVLQ
jgi:polysaccharide biosynthesis protein PslH